MKRWASALVVALLAGCGSSVTTLPDGGVDAGDAGLDGGDAGADGGDAGPDGGDAGVDGGDAGPDGGDAGPDGGDAGPDEGSVDRTFALWAPTADSPPPANYTAAADTVTDATTSLVWQRAVPAQTFTWQQAADSCANLALAGQQDWRLPTHIELLSLLDLGRSGPAIAATAFPGTPAEEFWSASLVTGSATFAWGVGFDTGGTHGTARTGSDRVRCVRGGRSAPAQHYTTLSGTVRDNATGLLWQEAVPSQSHSLADATTFCQGLSLGGLSSGWRVPRLKELETLVDIRSYAPAVDGIAFPDTPASGVSSNGFWSSTVYASLVSFTWGIGFDYGFSYSFAPANLYRVRCVH